MVKALLRLYVAFRSPRYFLVVLCTFIFVSLLLHFTHHYDSDWGGTNLTLSIEASIASAVLMKIAEESSEWSQRMLKAILALAEVMREMMHEDRARLEKIEANVDRILRAIDEGDEP